MSVNALLGLSILLVVIAVFAPLPIVTLCLLLTLALLVYEERMGPR